MKRAVKSRMPAGKKFMILLTSMFVGANMGVAAYFYLSKDLTDWQRNQPVDLMNSRGLTKAKAYIDSGIVAGLSFGICACTILIIGKIRGNKK